MGPDALSRPAARALRELERHGLLLVTDTRLPSLVALVAGGPVRGSSLLSGTMTFVQMRGLSASGRLAGEPGAGRLPWR